MKIKVWTNDPNAAAIEFGVPVGSHVEIHLYPGDIPTIEPHDERKYQQNVRLFDVVVDPNGDFRCDWVNVTQVANSGAGGAVYGQNAG